MFIATRTYWYIPSEFSGQVVGSHVTLWGLLKMTENLMPNTKQNGHSNTKDWGDIETCADLHD